MLNEALGLYNNIIHGKWAVMEFDVNYTWLTFNNDYYH